MHARMDGNECRGSQTDVNGKRWPVMAEGATD